MATTLRKMGIMGDTRVLFALEANTGAHHDVALNSNGELFVLTSILEGISSEQRGRCEITRFDNQTGELLWRTSYSSVFDGQYSLVNTTEESDVHFNSLEYIERLNLLITNSRSCSCTLFIDATTGEILYHLDNPSGQAVINAGTPLTPTDSENFQYGCGKHAFFYTTNPAYNQYNTGNSFALTVYDNQSCLNSDGLTDQERPIDTPLGTYQGYDFPMLALVYHVNLDDATITLLNKFSIDGLCSELMGSIYEIGNYYNICIPVRRTSNPAWVIFRL